MKKIIYCQAPAKVLLSGEYGVLVNGTSLGVAIDLWSRAQISDFEDYVFVNFAKEEKTFFAEVSQGLFYQNPFSEIKFQAMNFIWEELFKDYHGKKSFRIDLYGDIPQKCGLGSSAAFLNSIVWGINVFFSLKKNPDQLLEIAKKAENYYHGQSSGMDLRISTNGGVNFFCQGKLERLELSQNIFSSAYLVNTGTPIYETKKSVQHVLSKFNKEHSIWKDLKEITTKIAEDFKKADKDSFLKNIEKNQQILELLGVVPEKVKEFIKKCKTHNLITKLTGAGCYQGEGAGYLLVFGEGIDTLCKEFGYSWEKLKISERGVYIWE